MRWILPSAIAINLFGIAACHHEVAPVQPGPVISAEPVVKVGTMKAECDAGLAALESWKSCPNLDDRGREQIDAWLEVAKLDFGASEKVELDDKQQHAIALSCRRFVDSAHAAIERCDAGKPPPRQY
jgi:hypothetical protein|nr:hypothetical protein [Kofleriaceae bacterium]